MSDQIDMAGNHDDVYLFYKYYAPDAEPPQFFEDVPLRVLLPAYMLSELKTAFLMGFSNLLAILADRFSGGCHTISMGMMMLPPAMISLPFKLLLFCFDRRLAPGCRNVVGQFWNGRITPCDQMML